MRNFFEGFLKIIDNYKEIIYKCKGMGMHFYSTIFSKSEKPYSILFTHFRGYFIYTENHLKIIWFE